MVECVGEEDIATAEEHIAQRVFTGDNNTIRQLGRTLKNAIVKAVKIDIAVAYVKESGVRMLLPSLKEAVSRGANIRLLTGTNFNLTEPQALYLLRHYLGESIEIRFYTDKGRSFHPKAYFLHFVDCSSLFVGSSNMSSSALSMGIEWNYRLDSKVQSTDYQVFYQTFQELYQHHAVLVDDEVLKKYAKNWRRPSNEQSPITIGRDDECDDIFRPRGAQIEALYYLSQTREEGADKALVHAATGIGKTYLAAFDSKDFARVLFVAHREEILRQAAKSFRNVRGSDDYGFFTGQEKQNDKAVIFASVETLGQEKYLCDEYFSADCFDYIVVDEFHHAVCNRYQNIMAYFKPKFLLGLTATTERMDGRNIYALCDYNVVFELSLFSAINRGMLVPFRYYGIYDETDYRNMRLVNGSYATSDLNCLYLDNIRRMQNIVKHYRKYKSQRALGFCATREHAENMAWYFVKQGIKAVAVYSGAQGEYAMERSKAIAQLESGEISVIFVVDMFNEGVDIPSLDMVMFLRPTESPTVFMQQLGRGLRLYPGKNYLTILDFIGNYHNAGVVKWLLSREAKTAAGGRDKGEITYPDNCIVDFDLDLIDLFAQMEKGRQSLRDVIKGEFYRVKELLGYRPSRQELFVNMDAEVYEQCLKHTKENPFRNYLAYLISLGEATLAEQEIVSTLAANFLQEVSTTSMTKVYKMPVLMSLLGEQGIKEKITYQDVVKSWKDFFAKDRNWRDLPNIKSYNAYKELSDDWHLTKIKKMPLNYLQSDFFQTNGEYALVICEAMHPYLSSDVVREHFKDIVIYRALDYYRRRYITEQ